MYGNQPDDFEQQLTTGQLLAAAFFTALLFGGLSGLGAWWGYPPVWGTDGGPILSGSSLIWGTVGGAVAGAVMVSSWRNVPLTPIAEDFPVVRALLGAPIPLPAVLIVSASAGIFEELFFRGVLQPILGLWPTAVLFVLLHGYVQWKSWRHLLFTALVILLSAGLGYLAREVALSAAMLAHAVYDVAMLELLKRSPRPEDRRGLEIPRP